MIHAYVNNGQPQLRIGFPNRWTASLVVLSNGKVALSHFPTRTDDVNPRKFTDKEVEQYAREVVVDAEEADATELMLMLQIVEALPPPEIEDD